MQSPSCYDNSVTPSLSPAAHLTCESRLPFHSPAKPLKEQDEANAHAVVLTPGPVGAFLSTVESHAVVLTPETAIGGVPKLDDLGLGDLNKASFASSQIAASNDNDDSGAGKLETEPKEPPGIQKDSSTATVVKLFGLF